MFFNLEKWNEIYGPLPELLAPEKPAVYRNFTEQEYNDYILHLGAKQQVFHSEDSDGISFLSA